MPTERGEPTVAGVGARPGLLAPSLLATSVVAWVLTLGVDLFLHAGALARLYSAPSPFLLDADVAFRRIPLGYLAFFVLTLGLVWLMLRLEVRGAWAGARLGSAVGAVGWGALALGLYSISTASPALLAGWWLGQSIELGLAGAVIGARLGGAPLRRLWPRVLLAVLVLVVVTVVLQSLGLAPAMRLER